MQIPEGFHMHSVVKLIKRLKSDEEGASLVEYTVLLGILLIAVIAIIVAVGKWINTTWATLNTSI
jgi:pilus assembly protein Flp/PilA